MKTKKKIKTSPADKAFTVCNTIFMILFLIITLYPILNTLALAFNDGTDALRGGIYIWPRKWTLQNFITVLQKDNGYGTSCQCYTGIHRQQKKIFV